MIKIEHDTATNIVTEVPLTASEIKAIEKLQKEEAEKNAVIKAEAEAKETARQALLTKLGITAEEAQLLLGGN